ncbi:unnamed protein product [Ophioblennius macclurei]
MCSFLTSTMSAEKLDLGGPDVGLQEKTPPPPEEVPPLASPLDFSELTPDRFGISAQSFTPKSSSSCKEKSRLAQIKARRRSNIGARGSPETNSLIRFMAQQRIKMKTPQTPETLTRSPFLRPAASSLRQKMASFQTLMDVEESVTTREDLSAGTKGETKDGGKENEPPPPLTATPTKRRRLGHEIREAGALVLQEGRAFEDQSPCRRPPPVDPAPSSTSSPPPLQTEPTEEDGATATKKKKKQVRFGSPLSPEFFDKNLPPSTPLLRGGTPAGAAATPGGSFGLRSALKTPQRGESQTPDLGSPANFGASPTFSIPLQKVVPSAEEKSSPSTNDPELIFDAPPLDLNSAFQEESVASSCPSCPETNETPEAAVEVPPAATSNKRKRAAPEPESGGALAGRHRKQPDQRQSAKRSTRSAAKSASRKMKVTLGGARQWSKDVDRSLYGSREFASRNPNLSPITELIFMSHNAPVATAATGDKPHLTSDPDPNTADADVGNSARKSRTLKVRKRKVSVPDKEENCDQPAAAPGTRSEPDAPPRGETEEPSEVPSGATFCSDWDGKAEGEEPASTEQEGGARGRGCGEDLVLKEQQNLAAEGRWGQQEQEEEPRPSVEEVLAPWQAHFDFEDVFKPVATRGQRSVRRSLRLRCTDPQQGGDGEAGLAWIPRSSPDPDSKSRRRTRGRRLSAALPVQQEEPQSTS